MSQQSNQPTQEQIRAARHEGFDNSINHMEAERRARLTTSHRAQDARRETNVSSFVNSVAGGD